ncbi:hypothetical protein HDK64DRAFT_47487 [Phyllosticta capitalensis]
MAMIVEPNFKAIKRLKPFLKGPLVQLVAGREQYTFIVHQTLLCRASSFFTQAFCGPWREGRTKTIEFPHVEFHLMSAFIDWLYTGIFYRGDALELYVFADCYQIIQLKDDVLGALFLLWIKYSTQKHEKNKVRMDRLPSAEQLDFAIDNLPPSSPMLRLMYAIHANWSAPLPECYDWPELKAAMCRLVKHVPGRHSRIEYLHEYLEDSERERQYRVWRNEVRKWLARMEKYDKMRIEDGKDEEMIDLAECSVGLAERS